jgi:membrane protease YdiL (CAAX protease family)
MSAELPATEPASPQSPSPDGAPSSVQELFPWRETGGMLLGVLLLWLVYYHADPRTWPPACLQLLGPGWPQWLEHWARFGWFGFNFLALFLIPALVIKLLWRQRLRDYGLTLGGWRIWGRYFVVFGGVMVPVIAWSSSFPSLQAYYPLIRWAGDSAGAFALSAVGWLVYFFAWEWFFRGFLLNLFARRYGAIAIVVQAVPFVLMHFPKPEVEAFAAIIAGMALGIMAYRGKSFLGTWLLHWLVAISVDLLVILGQP